MLLFTIYSVCFFLLLTFISFVMIKASRLLQSKKLETQFLFMVVQFIEYKYHMIQMMELVYAEKIEQDQQKQLELDKIKQKIEEKFDNFGNEIVINIKKVLDYETEYSDWKGAVKYIEQKLSRVKLNGHRANH